MIKLWLVFDCIEQHMGFTALKLCRLMAIFRKTKEEGRIRYFH